jgi:dihydrolipoamide dehydrogenase
MFDLIVVGGGPGGYVAAIRAAQLGMMVACVEKRPAYGGTCLNVGCIPSKALLDSSELYHITQHKLAVHGINVKRADLDLGTLLKRKDQVVTSLTNGIGFLLQKNKVTKVAGTAKLLGGGRVEVAKPDGSKEVLEGKNIILATGSEVVQLPNLPFDHQYVVDSTDALKFSEVPKHLVVVGGGFIGLELGSVWARLGSKVTILEFLPHILPTTDREVATQVHKSLVKQGLDIQVETKVTGTRISGRQVTVTAANKEGTQIFAADKVLVAVGRKANIEGLGLDTAKVKYDPKSNKVEVDSKFQTNVPGIYAIGDLIAGPMLAHKAMEEGVAVAEILAGKPGHVNYDTVPSVCYIWPEVASVGKTEEQLKEANVEYRIGKFPFVASGRAKCMDETEGFVKVLADKATDRVLGVHIFGPRASDMIAEAVAIMEFKGSAEDIARIMHAHPTLSEALAEAGRAAWMGKAIHA